LGTKPWRDSAGVFYLAALQTRFQKRTNKKAALHLQSGFLLSDK